MSNTFVACETWTQLTASELVMLRALPEPGVAELEWEQEHWCELEPGHGGPHTALMQVNMSADAEPNDRHTEWWWLRWDAQERSLAAVPDCPASAGPSGLIDNAGCGLPRGHRGAHDYEFHDALLVHMNRYGLSVRITEAAAGEPVTPVVVFVNALGTPMARWESVLQPLRGRYRLLSYDRAGIGESYARPPDLRRVTYAGLADELVQLLDILDVREPVVLVGHSIGSLIARLFVSNHPDRVAGIVHVDGSIPELLADDVEGGPEVEGDDGTWLDGDNPDGCATIDWVAGIDEVNAATHRQVPGIVLVRSRGHHPELGPAYEERWSLAQGALAESSGALRIDALNAGHVIQDDEPALVVLAVRAVVTAVQTGQSTPTLTADTVRSAGGVLTR